jgi:hypothetical protein
LYERVDWRETYCKEAQAGKWRWRVPKQVLDESMVRMINDFFMGKKEVAVPLVFLAGLIFVLPSER